MADKQRTDSKLTVQSERVGMKPLIVAGVLALLVAWGWRDMWVDALAPPYPSKVDEQQRSEPQVPASPSADRLSSDADQRATGAQPQRGTLVGLISASDYPVEAIERDEQGTVTAELEIDRIGSVTSCTIAESSGSRSLDRRTCDVLSKRARFVPATDSEGRPIPGSHRQRITWRLEG